MPDRKAHAVKPAEDTPERRGRPAVDDQLTRLHVAGEVPVGDREQAQRRQWHRTPGVPELAGQPARSDGASGRIAEWNGGRPNTSADRARKRTASLWLMRHATVLACASFDPCSGPPRQLIGTCMLCIHKPI